MHSDKNFIKVLEGLQGATALLNEHMTPEIEAAMTDEQRELLAEAREATSTRQLKKMADKLEKLNENLRNNAT